MTCTFKSLASSRRAVCRCDGDVTAAAAVVYAPIDATPTAAGACGIVTDDDDNDEDMLCGKNDTVSSRDDVRTGVAAADTSLDVVVSSDCGTYVDVAGVYFSFLK